MISRQKIEEKLWQCQKETYGKIDEKEYRNYTWAFQALTWYINTGRASPAWIDAWMKANPVSLMRGAAKHSGSTTGCIDFISRYLSRYYGYRVN